MARPTKYDDAHAKTICGLLRAGCTRTASVASAGIDYKTFQAWMRRYSRFSSDVQKAEAEAENAMAKEIQSAAKLGDWRAAESWLKRRRRDDWGDSLNLTKLTDADLFSEAAKILDRAGAGGSGGTGAAGPDADAAGAAGDTQL